MSQYLTKMTLTTQAWANLMEKPQNRFDAVRPMFEAVGFKLLDYWFAVDQGAVYMRSEGPEDLTNMLAMEIATLGAGTISSCEVTRLLSAAEAVKSMEKAKSLGYRPTGSSTQAKK